jgi:hypothetical protein
MTLSNLVARCAAALISVALIACADPVQPEPDPDAAAQIGESEPLPSTLPPPSEAQPRFVGLWATTQNGCEAPPWRFRADGVSTQGEVSCDFSNTRVTSTGYTVDATCHAEGTTSTHQIQFAFAESARAMMVSHGPWAAPTSLVYCGPLSQP